MTKTNPKVQFMFSVAVSEQLHEKVLRLANLKNKKASVIVREALESYAQAHSDTAENAIQLQDEKRNRGSVATGPLY